MENYIIFNSKILGGKPIIKGTRIAVDLILRLLAQGETFDEIIKTYPHLKKDHILACLKYATQILEEEKVFPLKLGKREKTIV